MHRLCDESKKPSGRSRRARCPGEKLQPRVGRGLGINRGSPGEGLSRSTKLSVGDAVTVSGKLTCLPSTMPITREILVSGALSRTGGSNALLASYSCYVQ